MFLRFYSKNPSTDYARLVRLITFRRTLFGMRLETIDATISPTMTQLFQRPRTVSTQLAISAAFALIILNPTALPLDCSHPPDTLRYFSVLFNQAQTDAPIFRLFRLEGSSGREVAAKAKSVDKPKSPGFSLVSARLENDGMGALARIRTTLTIANQETRRITEVEWRLDVFDASVGNSTNRVVQSEKINIYSGETANVSARFGAVLPDRMVILLQVIRVTFAEGPSWVPSKECSLEPDLNTITCESR